MVSPTKFFLIALTWCLLNIAFTLQTSFTITKQDNKNEKTNNQYMYPIKAWIILTQASWGTITNQRIVDEVTGQVLENDDKYVTVQEIRNPTDVFDNMSLFVSFLAEQVDSLPGYYIIRFSPGTKNRKKLGYFKPNYVRLQKNHNQVSLELGVNSNAPIGTWLYYSKEPRIVNGFLLHSGWTKEPQKGNFFTATPFNNEFINDFPRGYADGNWHENVLLPVDYHFTRQGFQIALAEDLFDTLNQKLSVDSSFPIWDEDKIFASLIEKVIREYEDKKGQEAKDCRFNMRLEYGKKKLIYGQETAHDNLVEFYFA